MVVAGVAQVVQETGQGEDAMAGEEMLPAVTVIGKMDVPDPARGVKKVKVVDEVGLARSHVSAVEGLEKIALVDEIYHFFSLGQNILVRLEFPGPWHVFHREQHLSLSH